MKATISVLPSVDRGRVVFGVSVEHNGQTYGFPVYSSNHSGIASTGGVGSVPSAVTTAATECVIEYDRTNIDELDRLREEARKQREAMGPEAFALSC